MLEFSPKVADLPEWRHIVRLAQAEHDARLRMTGRNIHHGDISRPWTELRLYWTYESGELPPVGRPCDFIDADRDTTELEEFPVGLTQCQYIKDIFNAVTDLGDHMAIAWCIHRTYGRRDPVMAECGTWFRTSGPTTSLSVRLRSKIDV
jgi:hypothetical protein